MTLAEKNYLISRSVLYVVNLVLQYKKVQLTQRETRDSGACMKAHCEQNLSSPISAIDNGHNDFFIHSFLNAKRRNRSRAAAAV